MLVERGPIIVGASLQAALTGLALVFFALGTTLATLEPSPWKAVVSGAGFTVALLGWLRARRDDGLEPFLGSGEPSPTSFLDREQRRAVRSQLRGKTPTTAQSRELVDLLTRRQETVARNTWPGVIGIGVAVLGSNLDSPIIVGGFLVVIVGVAALALLERRRWRRVRAAIAQAPDSTHRDG